MNAYRDCVNAANLAEQAPAVRKTAREILEQLKKIEDYLYWAIEPEEQDAPRHWASCMIESAHALVDMAHEYRAELALNPPPKIAEDNPEDHLQSTR